MNSAAFIIKTQIWLIIFFAKKSETLFWFWFILFLNFKTHSFNVESFESAVFFPVWDNEGVGVFPSLTRTHAHPQYEAEFCSYKLLLL